MSKSPKKAKPKKCPFCHGQQVVAEICYNCMEHGCLECDGQGVLIFECDFCNNPGWEKRIPPQFLLKRKHKPKSKRRKIH